MTKPKLSVTNITIGIKVAGELLGFSATVVVWVNGEGLLPSVAVCLV
jgi:hypothetical protein